MPPDFYPGWPTGPDTAADRAGPSIADLVRRVAERQPAAVAVVEGEMRTTYGELVDEAAVLSSRIAAAAQPGEPVGLLLPNNGAYPVALVACLASGRPAIVLDRDYPEERNRLILAHSGTKAIVLRDGDDPNGLPAVRLGGDASVTAEADWIAPVFDPDAVAVVVYTSGSTGQPKGIALSQRALLHRARQLIETLGFGPADKSLPLGSPCTIAGLLQTFEALLAGATLVKCDVRTSGIGAVLDTIARERVTALFTTPALLRALCRIDGARSLLASLRCVHPSGDVLLSADVDLLRDVIPESCSILTAYGLSEAPGICHWFVRRDGFGAGRVPVGFPVGGYGCTIVDDEGRPVPSGETGELVVRSRFMSLGEWQDGVVVPGALQPDPLDPARRVLHTGDLVTQGRDGLITVLGRKDRQIQIRGMRVEPYEIECALRALPAVLDAAVVAHEIGDAKTLTAFVVLTGTADKEPLGDIKRHLHRVLPSHMQPSRILPVSALPLLPGYKIDVDALRVLAERPESSGTPTRPSTGLGDIAETAVAEAWTRVLGPRAETGMTFAEAGGDSLTLLTLVFQLESELGLSLPLAAFDHDMTAADMTRVIGTARAEGNQAERLAPGSPAMLLKSGTARPPVFLAPGLGGHAGELRLLGRFLGGNRPVYALLPGGLDGDAVPERIEALAARYARAIVGIQPKGPYLLVGYSLGGMILYETARQLRAEGREIALLALLESYPHIRFWPRRHWLALLGRRCLSHLSVMRRLAPRDIAPYAAARLSSLMRRLAARTGLPPGLVTNGRDGQLHRIPLALAAAERRYRPPRYDAAVIFFQPETTSGDSGHALPEDPLSVWRPLIGDMEIHRVPGDHASMISGEARSLAAALDWEIDKAIAPSAQKDGLQA
jgi:acyl-coenzyme A synthetase/AMP-(fatty) acid ligase/thioesterase domain-containing protein/acyl carrier protein